MPIKTSKKFHRGFSLVEALIGVALLGVVLVPMLFLSSSYFLNQLNKTRQSMEVSHNTAQFLNRFMEEIYQTSRLLPGTDSTHIYFSYYDSVAQREVKAGYQIRTPLGYTNPILERLIYNTNTANWDAMSPYAFDEANKILLQTSPAPVFTYCADSISPTCTSASYNNALLVRLKGWSFSNLAGSQSLSLSTDLDIYISAAASSADGALISEVAKEMYKIDTTQAFGAANTDLNLLNISPFTGQLNDVNVSAAAGAGILTTIYSSGCNGEGNMLVASDGRLYSADNGSYCGGDFITYHPSTGLTVIVDDSTGAGGNDFSMAISPVDGRVYFGEWASSAVGHFWTWHSSTGLTTIVSGQEAPGDRNTVVGPDGRVFFGNDGSNATARFWTWKSDTGLSTILAGTGTDPNKWFNIGRYCTEVSPIDGRVYFCAQNNTVSKNALFTWDPTAGGSPTSILYNQTGTIGKADMIVNPVTGGLYFADGGDADTGNYHYYNNTSGLTTIIYNPNGNDYDPGPATYNAHAVALDGRVAFHGWDDHFVTWKPGTSLTTLVLSNNYYAGRDSTLITQDGTHAFFSEWTWDGSYGQSLWDWDIANGLSTLVFTGYNSGQSEANYLSYYQYRHPQQSFMGPGGMVIRSDGRLFFTDNNPGGSGIWSWRNDTGLSTILAPVSGAYPGQESMVIDDNGRLYFPGDTNNIASAANGKPMYTWHESTGLSTIMGSGISNWGAGFMIRPIPGATGGIYFQSTNDLGLNTIYRWEPGIPPAYIKKITETGAPNKNTITFNAEVGTYIASIQDTNGNLFYVDSTNKMVDRYTNTPDSSGNATYNLASQFSWNGNATTIAAAAIDENTTGIALLDSGNKQIDIYSNRSATGSPSPGGFSVATQSALPTGLAVSSRTGNYLVLDSTIQGAGVSRYVNLNIYSNGGSYLRAIPIVVATGGANALSVDATGETNFKITLDSRRNILYLSAPSLSKIFAFSMPEYL